MAGVPPVASVSDRQPGTGWRRIVDDEMWLGRLMLAPAILYIALLIGAPFLLELYYSLTDITVGSPTMRFVGLQASLWSLVLVYPSFTVPFCTWLLMGFFKAIPRDLEEAAVLD